MTSASRVMPLNSYAQRGTSTLLNGRIRVSPGPGNNPRPEALVLKCLAVVKTLSLIEGHAGTSMSQSNGKEKTMPAEKEMVNMISNYLGSQGLEDEAEFIANKIFEATLQWAVPTNSDVIPHGILVLAFGHGVDECGNRFPRFLNEELATKAIKYYRLYKCPVWAQWEVGILLEKHIPLDDLNIIYPAYDNIKDCPLYLTTEDILRRIEGKVDKGKRLLVCSHRDHLWRSTWLVKKYGFEVCSFQKEMPTSYDKNNAQIWIQHRRRYLINDIISRFCKVRQDLDL